MHGGGECFSFVFASPISFHSSIPSFCSPQVYNWDLNTVPETNASDLVFETHKVSLSEAYLFHLPDEDPDIIQEDLDEAEWISVYLTTDEEPMELIKRIFQTTVGPMPVSQFIKRIVVVDDDIDVYDQNDVEWAIWSRVGDAGKIFILPDVVSFDMDLAAKDGKSVRVGIDATKDLDDSEKLKRAIIPGLEEINIEDYLQ